jgi:hypothetical protein
MMPKSINPALIKINAQILGCKFPGNLGAFFRAVGPKKPGYPGLRVATALLRKAWRSLLRKIR